MANSWDPSPVNQTGRLNGASSASYTGTPGSIRAGVAVHKVRVVCTSDAWVLISDAADASSADSTFMAAGAPEYFTCNPGQKISAVQYAAGGSLNVTNIS